MFEKSFELFAREGSYEGTLLAWCGIVDSVVFQWRDLSRIEQWLERFPDLLDADELRLTPELKGRVVATVFMSLLWGVPQDPRIHRWARRALAELRTMPDLSLAASTGHFLTVYSVWIGDHSVADEALAVLRERITGPNLPALARLNLLLSEGVHAWVTGRPEDSTRALVQGLRVAAANEIMILDGLFTIMMVHPFIYRGELNDAARLLGDLERLGRAEQSFLAGAYHFLASWIGLLRGDAPGALLHAKIALEGAPKTIGPYSEACLRVGSALSLFETGQRSLADEELSKVERFARSMGSRTLVFTCLLYRSLFAIEEREESLVTELLQEALLLGKRIGFVDCLWWQPRKMAALCDVALQQGIETEYVRSLIRARNLSPPAGATESWPWLVKVRSLGVFEVEVDGEPIRFSRKAQRRPLSLLKVLVTFGSKRVPESRIMDALWPDSDGDNAHQSLAVTVHRLRKLLRYPQVVIVENGFVTLDATFCWVDAWELESIADRALRTEDPNAFANLTKALERYRGPLLPDDIDEAWSHPARERLLQKIQRLTSRTVETANPTRQRAEASSPRNTPPHSTGP